VFLQAQLVRYVPGKIWGVVYQAQRMSGVIGARDVVVANLWQTLNTNLLALGVVGSSLLAWVASPWWILLVLPFLAAVEWVHRNPDLDRRLLGTATRVLRLQMDTRQALPMQSRPLVLSALLCLEWVFFFLAV